MSSIHKTTNVRSILHEALLTLERQVVFGIANPHNGICAALTLVLEDHTDDANMDAMDMLTSLLGHWPDGTGLSDYPVPGGWWRNEFSAFCRAVRNDTIWKGRYGKRRKALLRWLIQQTQP